MTGLWTRPRRQVDYDDFCPMLVSLHLMPRSSPSPLAFMHNSMNLVFANQDDKDVFYPLTTREIAEAHKHDLELNKMTDKHGYTTQLVENTEVSAKTTKW